MACRIRSSADKILQNRTKRESIHKLNPIHHITGSNGNFKKIKNNFQFKDFIVLRIYEYNPM